MEEELDAYDKKILFELDINARMSASKIAKKIKIPKETVNYRIKRLEKEGWINRLYTIFNASLFGYSYYRIFLKFKQTNFIHRNRNNRLYNKRSHMRQSPGTRRPV